MEETEVLDFDKICRLCLLEKGSMLRIFAKKKRNNRTPLPIRIMSCTSLEIYEGDGLPSSICPKCLWDVNQAFTFRERCDAANERLVQYLHRMSDANAAATTSASTPATSSRTNQSQPDSQGAAPMEVMDRQSIRRGAPDRDLPTQFKVESELEFKYEPQDGAISNADDDEDDKPISQLVAAAVAAGHRAFAQTPQPMSLQQAGDEDDDEADDAETVDGEEAENGDSDSADPDDSIDESDLETEPVAALVETEMGEDGIYDGDQHSIQPVPILNTPRPISVRKFLEAEFGPDSSYSQQKRFSNSEYSKIKKKQKSAEGKPIPKSGRFAREGWEAFNVLDLKPRKKYAPREKNLISNNSSPIIEQDGTKSKFRACMHCGKVVLGKNMGIHVKIHVGNKSHLCDICGKSFLYKKTLETHKRVHSGERPCVCKICDKTFRSSSRLSDHMSTHTGRKPFICEICAVAFRIKGHLKKHLRVHSGEKPYVCSFCEKAFSDAWNMKCHMRIHTGEKPPHACPVCGQCFLRRNKMEEHCKLTHGEEYVLPRKQNLVQRLKNDLVEMNDELRIIAEREREEMLRQEAERQLLASHFESQRQELADSLGISVPMPMPMPLPMPMPVPAFPGNLPAGIFGLQ